MKQNLLLPALTLTLTACVASISPMQPWGEYYPTAPAVAPVGHFPDGPPTFTPPPIGVRGVIAGDAEHFAWYPIMVPVAGVSPEQISDTYSASRGGGVRSHNASDIMAPRGTPVLAATEGVIVRISDNRLGGRTIYKLDLHRKFLYYYAHLDSYAQNLKVGQAVVQGQVIGFVGSTGNATTPHLHFQAMRMDSTRRDYWNSDPLDIRPFFSLKGEERR